MIQIDKKKKNYVEREQIKARSIIGGVILGGGCPQCVVRFLNLIMCVFLKKKNGSSFTNKQ